MAENKYKSESACPSNKKGHVYLPEKVMQLHNGAWSQKTVHKCKCGKTA